MSEYVVKNLFVGGKKGLRRLENLQKIADQFYNGNFSRMVNDLLNKRFNLDPETGEPLKSKPKKPCP